MRNGANSLLLTVDIDVGFYSGHDLDLASTAGRLRRGS